MKGAWLGFAGLVVAAAAGAQEPVISPKLAELQAPKFQVPFCSLKPDGKVKKGVDAFRKSFDAKTAEDRAARLAEAKTQIVEGIAEGQGQNAASWYYLARVYLNQGDVGGVDSAFSRAETLEPSCEIDINQYRQNAWAGLANAGLELQRAGDIDGAIGLFRDANRLFRKLPHVTSNIGVLFANTGQDDSAAAYFRQALEIAEEAAESDTSLVADRNANALNLALMYQRLDRHAEAIPVLRQYLAWDPGNIDARKALSHSFRGAGMVDSAQAIDDAMIAELARQNLDSLDTQDILNIGVAAFNAQSYEKAAEAFAKVVARNPYSRDAVYNLANAYLALKDNAKVVAAAEKLVALEPMNEDAYRLLGQGHRGLGHDAEVLKAAEKLVGLPFSLDMTSFQMGRDGARLVGTATGRNATDAQGRPIKTEPVTLVVEFMDVSGTVVDSKEVTVPVVPVGSSHEVSVDAKGSDIAGWRYRRKAG
jgi:tetratricopeptide (TPR) repeat protein